MAPPPAKRQKRLIVLSSDEEEQQTSIKPESHKHRAPISTLDSTACSNPKRSLPTRSRTKPKSSTSQAVNDGFAQKPTRSSRTTNKRQISKPISTFFNATDGSHPKSQQTHDVSTSQVDPEVEDLIEDVSPDEEKGTQRSTHEATRLVLDRRKKLVKEKPPSNSQRFKLGGNAAGAGIEKPFITSQVDNRPWSDRFGPGNLDELVVHKKKVSDVSSWLENVFKGRERKRLLILKGPSGAGKTATIFTLAKALDFELSEWRNPVGSEYSSEGYLSMSAQFQEFISRSGRFSRLHLAGDDDKIEDSPNFGDTKVETRRKVILLEEFPNTFLSTSSAMQSFRSSILEYLAVNTPALHSLSAKKHTDVVTPLVMVITENRLTTTTSARDSFTAHRLLGAEILSHPGVSVIEFNPVASTLLTKALDLVIHKEAKQSGRRRIPGPAVLKKLGEVGDVRSAIGSLEFLCLRGEDGDDWGGRVAAKAKRGANTSVTITNLEKESLEMVTQRESTLGLFHAVGKVVYNKRDDVPEQLPQPPHHLAGYTRTRVSQVSVEALMSEMGTDAETFIAALHENYVPSCEGTSSIDIINDCIDTLSDSDLLGSPRGGRIGVSGEYRGRSFQGAAADSLRQDEICFQLAVRGLLFSLPYPVKRRAHPVSVKNGGKNDTYKMFYPTSMRLSRQMEEIDGFLDRWLDRLRAGVPSSKQSVSAGSKQFAHSKSKGTQPISTHGEGNPQQVNQEEIEPVRTSLNCTKAELLLERLPYITKLEQQAPASSALRELEKLTQFHRIEVPTGEESEVEDAEDPAPIAEWTTDRPAHSKIEGPPSLQHGQVGNEAATLVLPDEEQVEKMYLSDDDIED